MNEAAQIVDAASRKKARRKLGFDLDDWNTAMVVFLAIAAAAATAVGVSQFIIIKLQKVAELEVKREFDQYKLDAAKKIAEANSAGEVAKAISAEARRQTALLQKESAALEADNLALQTSLRPRRLSFLGWTNNLERVAAITDGLKKHSGTSVFIQVVPDFEAQTFARDIASVLEQAGWKPQFVNETQSHMPETSFPEGVTIVTLSDGKSQTEAGTAFWMALSEADVLMSGTGTFGAFVLHKILDKPEPGYPYFEPPITAVFIRVGLKPFTSQFLEIQRRNMEREDRRFDRTLRAAYERSGSMMFSVPDHPPVAVRPGPNDEWIAINPAEQSLLPKRTSPTLVLPNGIMLRSSPPDSANKP